MVGDLVYDRLLIGVFVVAAISFIRLLVKPAPYGRHDTGESGPQIPTRLAWVIMEAPASLVYFWFFFTGPNAFSAVPLVLCLLWQLHYFHRAFIYPFTLSLPDGARMTLAPALAGSAYCAVNGYLNGSFASTHGVHLNNAWLGDPRFWLGIVLFLTGYAINKQSDRILRELRAPGETGYKIPYGGCYRWVSAPNYMGELMTWTGYALAAWSLAGVSFVVMSAANLIPRALTNHRWYHEKFTDYPPERKAIIPYVL